MTPKVSIVVPNYNHARFLPRRLSSIFDQSFQDFEIILMDDASTDNSRELLETYLGDSRVRFVFNEANSGSPFVQWNLGMSLATGTYIWLAESDDFCTPDFLETLVKELESDNQCGLAFCQSICVDLSDEVIGEFTYGQFPNRSRWNSNFRANGTEEIRQYFSIANPIPNASAVVFRAALSKNIGPAIERMTLAGDWLFWVQLLNKTNLAYVSKPMNCFRQAHEKSQRSRSAKKGLEILEGLEIYEYIETEIGLSDSQKKCALNTKIRQWMYLSWLHHFDTGTNKQIFARFKNLSLGVYSDSALFTEINIILRISLHAITQQPLLRKILKPIWLFLSR